MWSFINKGVISTGDVEGDVPFNFYSPISVPLILSFLIDFLNSDLSFSWELGW